MELGLGEAVNDGGIVNNLTVLPALRKEVEDEKAVGDVGKQFFEGFSKAVEDVGVLEHGFELVKDDDHGVI